MRASSVAQFSTSYGPVRIIDAAAIRNAPEFLSDEMSSRPATHSVIDVPWQHYSFASQAPQTSAGAAAATEPSASSYFMGYAHEPYGQHAFVEQLSAPAEAFQQQQQQQQHAFGYSSAFYPGYSFTPFSAGAYGPYPTQSTAYRPYPQPSPPHRRSRTAPARTLHRPAVPPPPIPGYPPQRTMTRGFSADPLDRGRFTAFSGPYKRPQPLYRKRRDGRIGYFQETDFGGGPVDYGLAFQRPVYPPYMEHTAPSFRRIRPYYAPSYTTYPPSTMHRPKRKHHPEKYPIIFRVVLKAAQLIIGAAILGLVLSPMRSASSFHDFVIRTRTEWQGAVVGITATFAILTAALLSTSFCLAHKVAAWRRFDALISVAAAFCYLVAGFIEAYFAACYPPNGAKIGAVLLFINVIAYVIDFWLSWAAGVTLL